MTHHADTTRQARRDAVLAALAETGVLSAACVVAGVNRATVFRWKKDDEEFAAAYADALEQAADKIESEARRRAVEGFDEPVYYKGELVGTIKRYSDTLLVNLLRADREKFRNQGTVQVNANVDIATAIIAARNRTGG